MAKDTYIRIHKVDVTYVDHYYEIRTKKEEFEFYFTSIANCARWLGVSYNAVKYCLLGRYSLCKGYSLEYVEDKPDETCFYIDPDKYRNPEIRNELGLPEAGTGIYYPNK